MPIQDTLQGIARKEYGPRYRDHVLDVYKTYVDMADRISSRRESTNSFFLTVNTAILGLLGFLAQAAGLPPGRTALLPVALAGVVIALLWRRILLSYRELNSAKYQVVHQLEASLPLRPYDAEWQALGRGKDPARYVPLTNVEGRVPWIFAGLHAAVALWAIPWDKILCLFGAA